MGDETMMRAVAALALSTVAGVLLAEETITTLLGMHRSAVAATWLVVSLAIGLGRLSG